MERWINGHIEQETEKEELAVGCRQKKNIIRGTPLQPAVRDCNTIPRNPDMKRFPLYASETYIYGAFLYHDEKKNYIYQRLTDTANELESIQRVVRT